MTDADKAKAFSLLAQEHTLPLGRMLLHSAGVTPIHYVEHLIRSCFPHRNLYQFRVKHIFPAASEMIFARTPELLNTLLSACDSDYHMMMIDFIKKKLNDWGVQVNSWETIRSPLWLHEVINFNKTVAIDFDPGDMALFENMAEVNTFESEREFDGVILGLEIMELLLL